MPKKKILVAPLNWGLGHATRCIPIINALEANNFEPIIASDGSALALLKKEFPHLKFYELPSYDIRYAKKGYFFKSKILLKTFKISKTITEERKIALEIYTKEDLSGIISDNRLGVNCKFIPSVFITHQLNVLSGKTTYFSSKLHQRYIKKFKECWVPDLEQEPNLSGKLGHLKEKNDFQLKYIGPLSRLNKRELPIIYDLMVMLSGPEPQRTLLEEKLLHELKDDPRKIIFIRGVMDEVQTKETRENLTIYNFLIGKALENAFNQSENILARSGYTTLMDLAKLEKKAFFIPTPGQTEQIYLAKRLQENNIAPYCKQHHFTIEKLEEIKLYQGLRFGNSIPEWSDMFSLF
ncbi:glycosyltransferase [Mesonia aestuariivivens]|uniref:Glycosyltransferase n=1 Tax=Mesonia aestuariivivens TaxID=2796128 RepID=A0ABS6VYW9_9FLAO|nr:glycosyltransferase [Mesonia aestuariivivens]MBW2960482.1 glycosyltransferase [Mesonia aestuariivivens]